MPSLTVWCVLTADSRWRCGPTQAFSSRIEEVAPSLEACTITTRFSWAICVFFRATYCVVSICTFETVFKLTLLAPVLMLILTSKVKYLLLSLFLQLHSAPVRWSSILASTWKLPSTMRSPVFRCTLPLPCFSCPTASASLSKFFWSSQTLTPTHSL